MKQKKYGIIYLVSFQNGKKYVGQTTGSLKRRKQNHLNHLIAEDTPFHRALLKYFNEKIVWEEIDTAFSKEELDEKEIYWIDYYQTCIKEGSECRGYNLTYGGAAATYFTWLTKQELIEFGEDFRQGYTPKQLYEKYSYTKIPYERMMQLYNGVTFTQFTKIPRRDYSQMPKMVKLDQEKVDKIIDLFKQYGEFKKVGELVEISEQQVANVIRGDVWSNYTGIHDLSFCMQYYRVSKIFTNDQINKIVQLKKEGKNRKEIGTIIGSNNYNAISRIMSGSNLGWYTGINHERIENKYT